MNSPSLFDTIVLGIVQGLTEFLPVSSSAHLIFVSEMQGGKVLPLSLNIAFHLGTLAAVLIYFWRDWLEITRTTLQPNYQSSSPTVSRKTFPAIIVGSIPAGAIGVIFKNDIERIFHHPLMTIGPLIIMGILLWLVDKYAPIRKGIREITLTDGLVIGLAQSLALIPGSSRSGSTIMGGRLIGYSRGEAARFSFLLGTPAMFGAAVLESKHLAEAANRPEFFVGILVSGLVGALAIRILLKLVASFGFLSFAIYRIGLAALIYWTVAV